VAVGASIGIAIDTEDMATVDDLLGAADIAMYQAKAGGKGRHQVFAEDGALTEQGVDEAAGQAAGLTPRTVRHAAPRLGLEPG
jgi:predicted signal transduction protein with EAL and GGDEF domain